MKICKDCGKELHKLDRFKQCTECMLCLKKTIMNELPKAKIDWFPEEQEVIDWYKNIIKQLPNQPYWQKKVREIDNASINEKATIITALVYLKGKYETDKVHSM